MRRPNELRDLDEWIGTHLFDLHEFEPNSVNNCICDSCGKDNSFSGHFRADWAHISGSLPRYTTSPAAAMTVLEKCLAKAESDVVFFKSTDHPGAYRVFRILDVNPAKGTPFVEADTLPLAIARFARNLFENEQKTI